MSRRLVLGSLVSLAIGTGSLWYLRTTPLVRTGILSILSVAYAACPWAVDQPVVNYGPPVATDAYHNSTDVVQTTTNGSWHLEIAQSPAHFDSLPRFQHEACDEEKLSEFTSLVPTLFEGRPDPFQLAAGIRSLTTHGPAILPPGDTDPVEYLRLALQKKPLTCRYFSVLHVTACVCRGYTARLVGLSTDGDSFDHAITEVYLPEYAGWVAIDTDFNVSWRRNGHWLSASDLHSAQSKGGAARDGIEVVVLGGAGRRLRESNLRDRNLHLFKFVFYANRNDYLTAAYPVGHPARTTQFLLSPPPPAKNANICPECIPVNDLKDVNFPVGKTSIHVASVRNDTLQLILSTWTPNFRSFEFRTAGGEWRDNFDGRLSLPLKTSPVSLEVRTVNQFGLRGETAFFKAARRDNELAEELSQ